MSDITKLAKVVLETNDLSSDQKMNLLHSLFNSGSNVENNNTDNTDEKTFKVTVKKRNLSETGHNSKKLVFGQRRWTDEDRKEFFTILVENFGPHSNWVSKTRPDAYTDMNDFFNQLSKRFARTEHALKAQLVEAVSPTVPLKDGKPNKGTFRLKEVAFDVGFIDDEVATS